MKKHFISLFGDEHRRKTVILLSVAFVLIVASQIIGITDNLPAIAMLISGIIILFFAVLHPWRKAENYVMLVGVGAGILFLEWLGIHILARIHKTQYISEGVAMVVGFFIGMPCIIVGMIGALICTLRRR